MPSEEVEALVLRAKELIEKCDIKAACSCLQRAVEIDPNNTDLLEGYAETLFDAGEVEQAQKVWRRSIELDGAGNPFKYLQLGQTLLGRESLQCFRRGIEILTHMRQSCPNDDQLDMHLSSAHCSVAELFTTDLCDEPEAHATCEEELQKAIAICRSNSDAYLALANLRCIEGKLEESKGYINVALELMASQDHAESSASFESRFTAAKLCLELSEFENALSLFEQLLLEDDRFVELWYLTGFCYMRIGDNVIASEYLQRALLMLEKSPNQELLEDVQALILEINAASSKQKQMDTDADAEAA